MERKMIELYEAMVMRKMHYVDMIQTDQLFLKAWRRIGDVKMINATKKSIEEKEKALHSREIWIN